eukprot:CAMPEP_0172304072 /NCGR_PEP_ID=MMETSP1058-20130122/5529_1 /TAXON_ID=83371 /ORGANISM="Detonula confervacea, Strain CCMP 353" /LENGTH=63 /DNA_ID=CAMNT_0013015151 /DNA_START=14 /DNA_END=201 /DNA_ORIENTATION=+
MSIMMIVISRAPNAWHQPVLRGLTSPVALISPVPTPKLQAVGPANPTTKRGAGPPVEAPPVAA